MKLDTPYINSHQQLEHCSLRIVNNKNYPERDLPTRLQRWTETEFCKMSFLMESAGANPLQSIFDFSGSKINEKKVRTLPSWYAFKGSEKVGP